MAPPLAGSMASPVAGAMAPPLAGSMAPSTAGSAAPEPGAWTTLIEEDWNLRFEDRPHNDLLVSVCNAMGLADVTSFGIPGVCTGALPGLGV